MKIFKYVTATASNWKDLDMEVNKLLAKGYQPYGNPYLSNGQIHVAQAMILHEGQTTETTVNLAGIKMVPDPG